MKVVKERVRVIGKEWLTEDTFTLRLERKEAQFHPGQYFVLALRDEGREYSVCSGLDDDYIEVMVRVVWQGIFTPRLAVLQKGDFITIEGPYGFFVMRSEEMKDCHYYFIATGTGISPFLSFIKTYPKLDYTLLHGVRYGYEAYRHSQIPHDRRLICTSRDETGDFHGRVTEYMKRKENIDLRSIYYLCGNSAMIEEMTGFLESGGVDPFDIRQEEFF